MSGSQIDYPFPRMPIALCVGVPVGFLLLFPLGALLGHEWNIHGDFALIVVPFMLSTVFSLVVLAVMLPRGFRCLIHQPEARSPLNFLFVALGSLFVAGAVVLVVSIAVTMGAH